MAQFRLYDVIKANKSNIVRNSQSKPGQFIVDCRRPKIGEQENRSRRIPSGEYLTN